MIIYIYIIIINYKEVFRQHHYGNNNHLYSHILEYMKYPNRAIQCAKFLTRQSMFKHVMQ